MFHTGLGSWVPGGFVGVDVFFVISGYLICAILTREFADGHFSIVRFYERRVRRIVPALYAMIAISFIVSAIILLPSEFAEFSSSVQATLLFASNIFFFLTTNYFDGGNTRPLLHTWSLAVEEQFYIFFPIYLWLMFRFCPKGLHASLLLLLSLSFLLCIWITQTHPSIAFYFPHTRAWELLAGAMVSLEVVPTPKRKPSRDILSLVGLTAILGSCIGFDDKMSFPGYWAAIPVAGSALLLAAGQTGTSLAGRWIANRTLVLVGLCSYSIYLWHWPLIVFVKLVPEVSVSQGRMWGLVVVGLSIGMGYLSWRFVETPFRSKTLFSPRSVFTLGGIGGAGLIVLASAAILSNGWSARFDGKTNRLGTFLNYDDSRYFRRGSCFLPSGGFEAFDKKTCLAATSAAARKNVLLLGDSHAAHLWYGLNRHAQANIMQATISGCRPVYPDKSDTSACARMIGRIYNDVVATHAVDAVILAGRWQNDDMAGFEATLQWARQRHVPMVIVGPVPEYDQALPRLLAFAHDRKSPTLPQRHLIAARFKVDQKVEALARRYDVSFVSLTRALCPTSICRTQIGDVPVQFDYGHLTFAGSAYVALNISSRLKPLLEQSALEQRPPLAISHRLKGLSLSPAWSPKLSAKIPPPGGAKRLDR